MRCDVFSQLDLSRASTQLKLSQIPSKIEWDLTNGPRSVSCNRAIRYSGFFGVRETWVRSLEIPWTNESKSSDWNGRFPPPPHDSPTCGPFNDD